MKNIPHIDRKVADFRNTIIYTRPDAPVVAHARAELKKLNGYQRLFPIRAVKTYNAITNFVIFTISDSYCFNPAYLGSIIIIGDRELSEISKVKPSIYYTCKTLETQTSGESDMPLIYYLLKNVSDENLFYTPTINQTL